jgi:hypothetical protein
MVSPVVPLFSGWNCDIKDASKAAEVWASGMPQQFKVQTMPAMGHCISKPGCAWMPEAGT